MKEIHVKLVFKVDDIISKENFNISQTFSSWLRLSNSWDVTEITEAKTEQ